MVGSFLAGGQKKPSQRSKKVRDERWEVVSLAGNVADMSPTCRPDTVMSANFSKIGMSRRHAKPKNRPRHTQFVCRFADTVNHGSYLPPPRRTAGDRPYIPTPMQIEELAMDARKAAAERWKVVAADAAASLKVADAAEEVIMPPRTRSSNRGRGASSSNRTSTTTTATTAAAVPTAPADASVVVAAAMGTSAGCLTSAAQRIGVPIPDLRIPMRVATRAEDDANKFVGSCNYHVSGSNHCSHPDLLLRMCNHGMCRIRIHHLCQLEWEEANGYEETTISRCQLHHPRVLGVPPPIPNAQVPVATMPTLPPITITKQRYNMCDTPPESQLTLDSDFDLNDDISFSGGGEQGGGENEVEAEEEEDAGVDGAELATLGSVFECDRINIKRMNDKEGWECGWCGVFFSPRHATRALKHVLKKVGYWSLQGSNPPSVPCSVYVIEWTEL